MAPSSPSSQDNNSSISIRSRLSTETIDGNIPGAFPGTPRNEDAFSPSLPTAFSTQQSLQQKVHERRAEYTRPKTIRIKVGSWNVASRKGTEKDIKGWFVDGKGVEEKLAGLPVSTKEHDARESIEDQESRHTRRQATIPKHDTGTLPGGKEIGLYVLGLQEVVDVNSTTEALKPYTDPAVANKFKASLEAALPPGYDLVAEQQLIGLLLLIYASPAVAGEVKSVSTTSVGTGVMGYMGNKGAVTARLVLGETTRLVFINSHLGAGADKASLERRNWDAEQVVSRTKFDPITDSMDITQSTGERIGDEDIAFWFGDLNYRLEGIPGEDVRKLLMLHTRNQYDISASSRAKMEKELRSPMASAEAVEIDRSSSDSASLNTSANGDSPPPEDSALQDVDPASLQTTISSLLPHDELLQQMKTRKAFHDGWVEAPIRFLPTYKYDVGTVGVFDSSDKKRGPSWCDRILHRTRRAVQEYHAKLEEENASKARDEEMRKRGLEEAAEDESVLYEYNPEEDGDEYDEAVDTKTEYVTTREGFEDEIQQEYYTAHQRVLSSDHKPLDAVFIFKYDAIIPELKAKVHAEVVRELDRNENETRPTITLVVDPTPGEASGTDTPDESSNHRVNFGNLRFGQPKDKWVTVANTGQVDAQVCFLNRMGDGGQIEPPIPIWIKTSIDHLPDVPQSSKLRLKSSTSSTSPLQHTTYTLSPGSTMNIKLIARVEAMEFVRRLNDDLATLDDVLILRVLGGRDHFLPVTGKFVQSGLEKSLDKLTSLVDSSRLEAGIRRLQHQRPGGSGSS